MWMKVIYVTTMMPIFYGNFGNPKLEKRISNPGGNGCVYACVGVQQYDVCICMRTHVVRNGQGVFKGAMKN